MVPAVSLLAVGVNAMHSHDQDLRALQRVVPGPRVEESQWSAEVQTGSVIVL